jgi:hypothetical protein
LQFNTRLRSALVMLTMLVAIAAHAQPPSSSVPPPPTMAAPATAVGSATSSSLALGDSVRYGVTPMKDAPGSRVVQAGTSLGNLTYHSGPVQHTQKIFTIFWDTGTALPSGYQTTINQFVQDLDSTPYYAINSQYSDGGGNISTHVVYGGTWHDSTNAIPETNLSFSDLSAEVARAKTANGWTSDANSYFQVYTPSGYASSVSGICALHWFANPAIGQVLYPVSGCFPGGTYPNGSVVDAAINVSAHEISETVTDPLGNAWYFVDTSGEIGDECNFNFGTRASDGSDVTLNGHKYLVQQLWSNAVSGCAMSYGVLSPPPATTLISPTGDIGTNQPTYTWNAVTGTNAATYYLLWVDNPAGTPIIQTWYPASSVCGSTTCSATPSVPVADGAYEWWVLTWNAAGDGTWSSPLTFVPGFFGTNLISPSGNSGTTTPTYTWAKVGASWYQLVVKNAAGTAVIDTWYTAASVCPTAGGTCSVTPSTALTPGPPGVMYTWSVETFYNVGGYGPFSGTLSFSVGGPPAASLYSPAGAIGTQTPSFRWSNVASASYYFLWVQNQAGTQVIGNWYPASSVCFTSGDESSDSACAVDPGVTLAVGNTHTWWVETWDGIGYGPWSSPLTFTPTAPTVATLSSPSGAVPTVQPTYIWNQVPTAAYYYLWVNDGVTPVIQTWYTSDSICGSGICSVTPTTTLTNGTSHTWWIETWNPIAYGPWSTGMNFVPTATVPLATTQVNPANNHVETSPGVTFQWNKVTASTWYELWLNNTSANLLQYWITGPSVCGLTLCSLPTPIALTSGSYSWWIRTWSPAGYGPWSAGASFSIQSAPTSIVLTWNQYPMDLDGHLLTPEIGGLYYHVYWANRGSTTSPPYALQEEDVTSGFGAENIDVAQRFAGTYRYYVHNYSNAPPLAGSGATVRIYSYDTLVTTLTAPAAGTGDYWQVCDINGATGALVSCPNVVGDLEPPAASRPNINAGSGLKVKPAAAAIKEN